MVSVEDVGERALRLLERAYLFILDILIKAVPALSRVVERIQRFDGERLYPFFERRGIEVRDYIVFKLQAASGLFLIVSTLFIAGSIGARAYTVFGAALLSLIIYLLYVPIKRDFEDYPAYRDLFLSFMALVVIIAAVKVKKPFVKVVFPFFHFTAIALIGVIVIYGYFLKRYSRDYAVGRVVAVEGPYIRVRFNYDLRSNVKPQTALLSNTMNAREGDLVKVRVEKGLLSLRGSRPAEVIGVEWV